MVHTKRKRNLTLTLSYTRKKKRREGGGGGGERGGKIRIFQRGLFSLSFFIVSAGFCVQRIEFAKKETLFPFNILTPIKSHDRETGERERGEKKKRGKGKGGRERNESRELSPPS